jgi:sugar phosphate isomerase/epimerase
MKLGVFTVLLAGRGLEETLEYLSQLGVQAVEISPKTQAGTHANAAELLADPAKLESFKATIKKYNMEISALNCSGTPVHPQSEIAARSNTAFENAVLLAEKLGVTRVIAFSGCPGDGPGARYPNWVTCPWPDDFIKILDYQWNEVLIPYWKKASEFALSHGVDKIALEMHPGLCVYNPETLLKLRSAVGSNIGANFDPSHLFWQGIDPAAAIKKLGPAVFHFHAKDTKIDSANTSVNGVLDTKHYSDLLGRSWVFRTVGYGHGPEVWKDIISALRMVGYDHVLSIEHEDSLMSIDEGLRKGIAFLKDVMIAEKPQGMWWA